MTAEQFEAWMSSNARFRSAGESDGH